MSKLQIQLKSDLVAAMKNKDTFKRDTIRFLMSALKQVEVDERKELEDSDIIKIIQKSIKQREDSAEQYRNAGRDDLYQKEAKESEILQSYLPKQLSDDELKNILSRLIAKIGATSLKELGTLMSVSLKECEGKADGKRISSLAKGECNKFCVNT